MPLEKLRDAKGTASTTDKFATPPSRHIIKGSNVIQ